MQAAEKLVRKQFLISTMQIKKLDLLAKKQNVSAAQLVRAAIDAYNPDISDMKESELLELVSTRVKEAIVDTQETQKRLNKTLQILAERG
jgi:hypothetical protein